jgi:hypothetical protein
MPGGGKPLSPCSYSECYGIHESAEYHWVIFAVEIGATYSFSLVHSRSSNQKALQRCCAALFTVSLVYASFTVIFVLKKHHGVTYNRRALERSRARV